jgi:hypothetical protein
LPCQLVLYSVTGPLSLATNNTPEALSARPLGPSSWVWSPCISQTGETLPLDPGANAVMLLSPALET